MRWHLKGYLNGPGDGALRESVTNVFQAPFAYKGMTPDAQGTRAGEVGGPLHLDFRNGITGADVFIDGYFYKW